MALDLGSPAQAIQPDLRASIEQALAREPSLRNRDIAVELGNDGSVLLRGRVDDLADQMRAMKVVRSVAGVHQFVASFGAGGKREIKQRARSRAAIVVQAK